jgi:hypothetical protein
MTSRYSIHSLRAGEKETGRILRTFFRSFVAPGRERSEPSDALDRAAVKEPERR